MKQFFKYVLASCIGIFLFLFVLLLIGGGVGLAGMIKSKFDKGFEKESILVMDFKTKLPEKTNNVERPPFIFNDNNVVGVHAVLEILEHAAENDKIKGLYIKTNSMPTAFYSNARLLRKGIQEFKQSGKFVYAYGDYFTQGGYYLASAADSIFLNPIGGIDLRGLGAELLYFKDMLDKIGVEPKVFYAGKFKSATEPFRRNDMSEENRTQTRAFLEDVQERLIKDIAESRNLTRDRVLEIMNNFESRRAHLALNAGLIDAAWQKEDLLEMFKSRMGVDEYDDIDYIDFNDYYNKMDRDDDDSDDEIAVVIAEGSIVDNSDENGVIDGDRYAEIIREIRQDEDIDAIVLRVNSGGGSVLASDKIYHEINMAKEAGKKIVVSMGDFAASGGYYISCNADSIFAQENTITGSIGVFGLFFNAEELFNEKMGIHADTVKTTRFSALGQGVMPLDEDYAAIIQEFIDTTYNDFKSKVARGRNLTMEQVEEIAQGRVWTGQKGLEIGLVDKLGDLDDAIGSAAALAGIDTYKLKYYPKIKDPLEQFIKEFTGQGAAQAEALEQKLQELIPHYERLQTLSEINGSIQARMPYEMKVD